jgi:hypothetical protein
MINFNLSIVYQQKYAQLGYGLPTSQPVTAVAALN